MPLPCKNNSAEPKRTLYHSELVKYCAENQGRVWMMFLSKARDSMQYRNRKDTGPRIDAKVTFPNDVIDRRNYQVEDAMMRDAMNRAPLNEWLVVEAKGGEGKEELHIFDKDGTLVTVARVAAQSSNAATASPAALPGSPPALPGPPTQASQTPADRPQNQPVDANKPAPSAPPADASSQPMGEAPAPRTRGTIADDIFNAWMVAHYVAGKIKEVTGEVWSEETRAGYAHAIHIQFNKEYGQRPMAPKPVMEAIIDRLKKAKAARPASPIAQNGNGSAPQAAPQASAPAPQSRPSNGAGVPAVTPAVTQGAANASQWHAAGLPDPNDDDLPF